MAQPAAISFVTDVFRPTPIDARPRQPVSSAVEELHRGLMEELDPSRRGNIHVELGKIALKDGRLDAAARHFREALELDPRLEQARRWLEEIGEKVEQHEPKGLRAVLARANPFRR